MLDKSYKLERHSKEEYHLRLPIDADWDDRKQRVLIVLETVDSQDLHESVLLHERSRIVLENLLRFSISRAKAHGFNRRDCAFAAVNFNNVKFMDKAKETWGSYKEQFRKRIVKVVDQLKPTHILVLGDNAATTLLTKYEIEHVNKKRGWVFDLKIKGNKVKVCTSLDLNPLYTKPRDVNADEDDEDDDDQIGKDIYAKSNLLFYVSDHVTNLLCGKLLFDLSHIKPKPIYVDTIKKFKKLYAKLEEAKFVALDTETKNGTVNHNAIHTLQFAFEDSEAYFLPYKHPETPWNKEQLAYIGKKLRNYLRAEPGVLPLKYIITQYGMFDLRVCRVEFGIPVIHHAIWEITAGEYCLDENRGQLAGKPFHTPHGGLEQIFMVYGNDHYKKSPFGKGDRANPNLTKLSNPDFIDYGCMDVQSIVGIHTMQKARASYLKVGEKDFLPYFKKLVLHQMSNTVHSLSHMMQKGSAIDRIYLALLKSNASPLLKLLNEAKGDMMKTKEIAKANKILLKESSGQASMGGLFNRELVVFDFGKQLHKEILFFNVMGLKPVSWTKMKAPQINKTFIKAYERDHPIVESFGKFQKLGKLWSAYVKGWWNKIQDSADSKMDWRLRASYGFFNVVTGRLNSYDPSLQQVPTRGSAAKYIKRAFIAPVGNLLLKYDYSAHEVRVWSYVSGDSVLASVFKVGQALRQTLRKTTNPKKLADIFAELKKKGDVHIQNVKRFFDLWVDKEHPLRDAIKSVVFGVIYQKSAKSLAKDIWTNAKNQLDDKKYALTKERKTCTDKKRLAEIETALEALKPQYKELKDDDKRELSQSIMDKMFAEFKKGAEWLEWSKDHAKQHYYTYSPIGMRRNLFGIMSGIQSIVSAMARRAANSPVQGFASQIGVTASRLITLEAYKTFMKLGYIDEDTRDMPADIVKAVHDALHSEVPYKVLLVYIHIVQWAATYGVTKYYEDVYGIKFPIEPEIEIELGASEDNLYKWNWTDAHLKEIILKGLQDQQKIKTLVDKTPEQVMKRIYKAYDDPKIKSYLNKHYPILGVREKEEA